MNVGYKLYREVRDFAPRDWSASELVVAWVIADDARDDTRRSWIPLPLLCQRARLKPSTVREVLAKLAARGFEFRVCHGYGKDGRPVFAVKGHAVDYLVPDMLKGAGIPAAYEPFEPVDNSPKGAGEPAAIPAPSEPKGAGIPVIGAGEPAAIGLKGAGEPAPLPSVKNYLNKKNSTEAVCELDGPVEDAHATQGQDHVNGFTSPTASRHGMTAIEYESWIATRR